MHTLIIGGTGFGKSTYACQLASAASCSNFPVIVLDPMLDSRWPEGSIVTDDAERFEALLRDEENLNAWAFIDEGHDSIGANRWSNNLHWLFRFGRHFGHKVTVVTQHPTDLPPIVRNQCRRLVCFNIDGDTAYNLYRQYNCEELRSAPNLEVFEYIFVHRGGGGPPSRGKITP